MVLAGGLVVVALGLVAALALDGMSGRGGPVLAERASLAPGEKFPERAPRAADGTGAGIDSGSPWRENAGQFVPAAPGAPRLAILLLDDGSDAGAALSGMRLPAPVTLAIAPSADAAANRADAARRFGREVLLLLPMQAEDSFDTAPNPIALHVSRDELIRRLDWNLAQIDGYVGAINRHGEAASRDADAMRVVMESLDAKGLGFIDARSHDESVAGAVARRLGLPTGDVNFQVGSLAEEAALAATLAEACDHARRWGTAIVAIPAERRLVGALKEWLAAAPAGIEIVPVTAAVNRLRSGRVNG